MYTITHKSLIDYTLSILSLRHKLYIRVALAIAMVAVFLSLVSAAVIYAYKLNRQTELNNQMVNQLVQSAERPSAIAAYLEDDDLGLEIINGLVAMDLVAAASITNFEYMSLQSGDMTKAGEAITVDLIHPFRGSEVIGYLVVHPDERHSQKEARQTALENAIALVLLSVIIAGAVALFVHRRLTSPIQRLTQGFSSVDPNVPESMQSIDIGYRKRDEFGTLVSGINALMIALKQNLQTERILRERTQKLEQRFRLLFEQASAGIGLIGADNRLITMNKAMQRLFDDIEEGELFTALFVDEERLAETLQQMRTVEPLGQLSLDLEFTHDNQKRYVHCLFAKVSEQRVTRRIDQSTLIEVIAYDVTERIQREQQTRFEADHDSLTGLRNRRSGELALKQALAATQQKRAYFVLMMVDLDKFKPVNDTYGHEVGDEVLVTMAHRLKRHFDTHSDICVRWGGDEFVIGFKHTELDEEALSSLATLILDELRTPVNVSPTITCQIGGSIGIVHSNSSTQVLDDMLQLADETMYDVKQGGRDAYAIKSAD